MDIALAFILSTTLILSFITIGQTIYYRKRVTCMTGMMIAMTLGMSVGLIMGLIMGILFSGNLFFSTASGMLIGVLVGFLAGLPVSIMAVLDGLLSGLMGGMMGAMLGEMILPEYRGAMVKIMFLLFLTTLLLLLYMMQKELKQRETSLYMSPFLTIALFGLFFLVFDQLGPVFPEVASTKQNHHEKEDLLVQAEEFAFSPNKMSIQAGKKVTLTLNNRGKVVHELKILGLPVEEGVKSNMQEHRQTNAPIHIHAAPREEQSVSFIPVERGTYRFVCTLPGHEESGMVGTIEVS